MCRKASGLPEIIKRRKKKGRTLWSAQRCSETKQATPVGLKSKNIAMLNLTYKTCVLFHLFTLGHVLHSSCFNIKVLICNEMSLQARPGGRHNVEILRWSWISFLWRVLQIWKNGKNRTRNLWVSNTQTLYRVSVSVNAKKFFVAVSNVSCAIANLSHKE